MKKRKAKKTVRRATKRFPIMVPKRVILRWIKMYVPVAEMLKVPGIQTELIRRGMATRKQIAVARKVDLDLRKEGLLTARAAEVLGDVQRAKVWLHKPLRVLGGKAPIQCNLTAGLEVLGRLEHGVFA